MVGVGLLTRAATGEWEADGGGREGAFWAVGDYEVADYSRDGHDQVEGVDVEGYQKQGGPSSSQTQA